MNQYVNKHFNLEKVDLIIYSSLTANDPNGPFVIKVENNFAKYCRCVSEPFL